MIIINMMTATESQHDNVYKQVFPPNHTPPYPLPFVWRCLYIICVEQGTVQFYRQAPGVRLACKTVPGVVRKWYVSCMEVVRKLYAEDIQT